MPKYKKKSFYPHEKSYKPKIVRPLVGSTPNRVLKVVVYECLFEVTCSSLYYLFSYYGSVLRIVMFHKNGLQSAMVEYDSIDAASKAKNFLNDFNMFHTCNRLQIEFAWTEMLTVVKNDDKKAWDFTRHQSSYDQAPAVYYTEINNCYQQNLQPYQQQIHETQVNPLNISDYQPQAVFSPVPLMDDLNVILIDGLINDSTNPDKLFNLLSLYGNVNKIQFFYNRPGVALIQMFDYYSAENCIKYLNNAPIGSSGMIRVSWSPMSLIPSDFNSFRMADGSSSFKDFSASKNQRFLVPRPAYWIQPLSKIIRYYNTPANTSADIINKIFTNRNSTPKNVKVLPPDEDTRLSRGLIEFNSIGSAVVAVMKCNNRELRSATSKHYMKLCFSSSQTIDLKY